MNRVGTYLNSVSDELVAASGRAATVTNRGDIGTNREHLLLDFLGAHLPRRMSSSLGGMVVGVDGTESGQIDILVANDLGLRFEANARTFLTAESVAAAISVKSHLGTAEIEDSLRNLASIPDPSPDLMTFPLLRDPSAAFRRFVEVHPTKVIFGFSGMQPDSTLRAVQDGLELLPEAVRGRLLVVVNGSHIVSHHPEGAVTSTGMTIEPGSTFVSVLPSDKRGYGLTMLLNKVSAYVDWLAFMRVSITEHLT